MAGSYNHIIDDNGDLLSNERFVGVIESLGDAYEMAEEMYGMIWWLADVEPNHLSPAERVEQARQNHQAGLAMARATTKRKHR